ncbi:SPOR domain-containing protein [uncultured Aliiroseovarius sp.]|uniref:SPOR domain-containing protein n=1 Tax=uncultured Aliiroseovarius sp. TaxID=1658783 RepID=UPI0025936BBB|nr:SPOR domain-containing protein [uncultured Aliiroseovarius sp.]
MAEANWGHATPQATYNNQYDQGYAPTHRVEPPVMGTASQAGMHGGLQPTSHIARMADLTGDDAQPASGQSGAGGVGTALNYAGAALSLALIVGLGVWGYKLAVRDVTGIPVVRAIEGPMRIQPENPGGQSAAHQGFAVNSVQSEGQAAAPADRLVLAPAPEELEEEDMLTEVAADEAISSAVALPLHAASAVVPEPERAKPDQVDPVAAALAIAQQIAADVQGDTADAAEAKPQDVSATAEDVVQAKIIPASVPGVRTSPRPSGRPANLDTRVSVVSPPTSVAASVTDVAPDKIAAGTRLVQLGAFDSADVARAEWTKLATRFEDYFEGKSRVVQKAQSGGKTFYRLRALGFDDLADARRFCSVLMASKAACIPVVNR